MQREKKIKVDSKNLQYTSTEKYAKYATKLPYNFHLHFFPLRKFSYILYILQYKYTFTV